MDARAQQYQAMTNATPPNEEDVLTPRPAPRHEMRDLTVVFDPELAITEADLVRAAHHRAITSLRIACLPESGDYYLTLRLGWRGDHQLYVCTLRNRHEPRGWKSLERLIAYLREKVPGIEAITLHLS